MTAIKKGVTDMGSDEKETEEEIDHQSDVPNELESGNWHQRAKAARLMGVSASTLRRMHQKGEVEAKRVEGEWWFNVDGLEASKAEMSMGPEALISASAELVRASQAHNEKLLALIATPMAKILDATAEENQRLRARIESLENKNSEMLSAAEAAASLAQERELARKEAEARIARGDKAFGILASFIPHIVSRIGAMKAPGDAKAQAAPIEALLSGITREQIENFVALDVLTNPQLDLLMATIKSQGTDLAAASALLGSLTKEQLGKIATSGIFPATQMTLMREVVSALQKKTEPQPS